MGSLFKWLVCVLCVMVFPPTWAQEKDDVFSGVSLHIAGQATRLVPVTEEQIQAAKNTQAEPNIVGVILQDMEGNLHQYPFLFELTQLDKLLQGGMLVAAFPKLDYSNILSLQVGIVSGFKDFFVSSTGISLQDVILTRGKGAVFGFGVTRQ